MRVPIYVRPLTDTERTQVAAGLRSRDWFTLRRSQIVQASASGATAPAIARVLGCTKQTVLNAINDFNTRGEAALVRVVSLPPLPPSAFDLAGRERLREMLHQSPRLFGRPTSLWTLELADLRFRTGADGGAGERRDHARKGPDMPRYVRTNGHGLATRQEVDHQPRPRVQKKKRARDRLIRLAERHSDWVLGFQDEVWWSRLAQPALHSWTEADQFLRLVEQAVAKNDPDPKALACYGLYLRASSAEEVSQMWLRFVDGRPVSGLTTQFLAWCSEQLAATGKKALLLPWDNAPWHSSHEVRNWLRAHNRAVKRTGIGVRILACYLPVKSPWLNAIEPKWVHGKRAIVEPTRLLAAEEVEERVCAHFHCPRLPRLTLTKPGDLPTFTKIAA